MTAREPRERPRDEAFRAIFLAHLPYVYRTLQRLGIRERDLEDEAHDLFLKVYGRFHEYDPERHIRPWLLAFAVRHASDYRQSARIRREVGADEAPLALATLSGSEGDPDAALELRERRGVVLAAIDQIESFDQRVVFVMHEIDERAIPEIAEQLGIPLNTAYSRLRAARESFRAAVLTDRDARRSPKGGPS